jgi:flagellar basal body P-ring formation protein FlgA
MKSAANQIDFRAKKLVIATVAACAALFALALTAAHAQQTTRLKPIATVETDVVRLGDLVDGLQNSGDVAIFGAPQPGASGMISTSRIIAAAREHGITGVETSGLSTVTVRRLGRRITVEEITAALTQALIKDHSLAKDTEIELNAGQFEMTIESNATEPVTIRNLSYNGGSGRFEASYVVPGSRAMELTPGKIIGNVADVIRVPVLAKPVLRGDVVTSADIVMERRRRSDLGADTYLDTSRIVGNAARRPLPRGTLLREADIQRPEIIEKNATVTMTYDQPGIQLSMRGKALAGGAMGDTIQVQNINSKKTVEAIITGANRVAVTGAVLSQPQKTARNNTSVQ